MKQRLLVFHRTIAPYRIDFFNDLSQAFETRICLQYKNLLNQKFDYSKIAAQFKFTPIYLKELGRLKNMVISRGYWEQLDEYRPDVVLVSEFGLDCLAVLFHRWMKRKRYKVVSVCDDSYNMVAENNDFSKIHRTLRNLIVPRLDDLILVEPKVTEWYRWHFGKGYCFPIIKQEEKTRNVYQALLPLSQKMAEEQGLSRKFVFLFVGRLVALKNVATLLKAFIRLDRKDAALVIVGEGPEREALTNIAQTTDADIRFTGRLEGDELWQWYNIANCFILASYQEAFGAVTNEALLAGCKCLISNKAGSACLIGEGNGYTFEPTDANELTGKMRLMLEECQPVNFQTLRSSQMVLTYQSAIADLTLHLNNLEV